MPDRAFALITSKAVVARTLACVRSLETVGALAGAQAYVLCLDAEAQAILDGTAPDHVTTLTATDIPETAQFSDRPISRFAVACKPYVMRWIMAHTDAAKVLYFDSDIWFARDPSYLFDELDTHDILIVPYMLNAEATMQDWVGIAKNAQRTGYYNAGFVGASAKADAFLDWWADRCAYSTFRDFYEEVSGDQKYLNWVPSLFDNVGVQRHYGLNVKPWNLHYYSFERRADGSPTVNGDPVIYFHFSQDLGNLLQWPEAFYPEVERYLAELEQARADTGLPYVDMPRRDNSDLTRPLLPRGGKQAQLFSLMRNYRKPFEAAGQTLRAAVARGAHVLPALEERTVQQFLADWNLPGDAALADYDAVARDLETLALAEPVVCLGVNRLAFYLAYLGHGVSLYEPFQGYFNRALHRPFNPQWREATTMRDQLGIAERMLLHREPLAAAVDGPTPTTLVISAARVPEEVRPIVEALVGTATLARVVVLFDAEWPDDYRATYRQMMDDLLAGRATATDHMTTIDLVRVNS